MGNVCVTCPPRGLPRPMPTGVWRDVRFGFFFMHHDITMAPAGNIYNYMCRC